VACASHAQAALITWEVSGHVTKIEGDPSAIATAGGSAALGDAFTLQYSFDPAVASVDIDFSPTHLDWGFAIQDTRFQIGTWVRDIPPQTFATSSNSHIEVAANDPNVGFVYGMSAEQWFGGQPHGNGVIAGWVFQATNAGGSSLANSTDIPTTPFDLDAFTFLNGPQLQVSLNLSPTLESDILGSVDSVRVVANPTSAIPEPRTWALMLAGFAGLGAAVRSRRKLAQST